MYVVFLILGIAGVLLASNRVRPDIVALFVLLALLLTGVLTPEEAFAGFGNPVVVLVASLLVVSEGLTRTGAPQAISQLVVRAAGENETRMLIVVVLAAAVLSSLMNGTAVIAILIPAVMTVGRRTGISESRLLLPLYHGALVGGMLTLIATTPNIVARGELLQEGFEGFDFFDFTPIGLAVLGAGLLYMLVVGRRLLPADKDKEADAPRFAIDDLSSAFGVRGTASRLRVRKHSTLVDKALKGSEIRTRHGVWVVMVERRDRLGETTKAAPRSGFVLRANDVLVALGPQDAIGELIEDADLEQLPSDDSHRRQWFRDAGLAVVLIHPPSRLVGKALRSLRFHSHYGLIALGLRRRNTLVESFTEQPLREGDELLLLGSWDQIGRLREAVNDFVVLTTPSELADVAPARPRMPVALAILAAMILMSALEVVPVVVSVLLAAAALVATGCLSIADAYRSISLRTLVLVGGMLPAATAMENTGAVDAIVAGLTGALTGAGPYAMMSVIFFATVGLGIFFSGTVAVVLLAPVAIGLAEIMGFQPHAFVMIAAIGASTAFIAPLSASANMVMTAGGYRFSDFVKVGVPMIVLTWLVSILVTPLVFRF